MKTMKKLTMICGCLTLLIAINLHAQTAAELNEQAMQEISKGKVEEGINLLKKAVEVDSNYAKSYINLGFIYYSSSMLEQAIPLYFKALQLSPEDAMAHNNLGAALLAFGDIRRAIFEYRKALEYKPDYPEAHNNLAFALHSAGGFDQAIEEAQKALALKPNYPRAHNNLGMSYHAKGKYKEAETSFLKGLEQDPQMISALDNLGSLYRQQGKLKESVEAHQKAIQIDSLSAESYNGLGLSLLNGGRLNAAIATFKRALEIVPNYALAHNNVSYAFYTKLNYSMAMQHASAAERHGLKMNDVYMDDLKKALDKDYFRARHILVATQAEMDSVVSEYNSGKGFARLAAAKSIDKNTAAKGGDLGYFKKGEMLADFETAILNTPKGKVSAIVKTEMGFHLFQRLK